MAILIAACTSPSTSGDQVATPDQRPALAAALRETAVDLSVQGAAVAIIEPDGRMRTATFGTFGPGESPVTSSTRFPIASITKSFTAAIALGLAEVRAVDLDQPVTLDGLPPMATLRDLLGHTSGLPYEAGQRESPWTAAQLTEPAPTPRCEVRTCFAYSDLGYVAAALELEAATGEPYAELLQRQILDPLDLHDTELIVGADLLTDGVVPMPEVLIETWAAGAIVSTAPDLARFGRALVEGDLLTERSRRAQQDIERSAGLPTPDPGDPRPYGLGLACIEAFGRVAWGHDGSSGAILRHFPATGHTVAVLTTRPGSGPRLLGAVLQAVPALALDATPNPRDGAHPSCDDP